MTEHLSDESMEMLDGWARADADLLARGRVNREAPAANDDIDETLADRQAARAVFSAIDNTDTADEVKRVTATERLMRRSGVYSKYTPVPSHKFLKNQRRAKQEALGKVAREVKDA